MSSDWTISTLGEVCEKITDGAHNSPKSVSHGKPMASVKDLTRFGVDLSDARLISFEEYEKLVKQGCKPDVGDVLIAKDGNTALDTVCTVDEPLDAVLLSSVAILRPKRSVLNSDFLKYYLSSKNTIDYLKSNFISGAAIPRVVLKDFRKAEIKFPSLVQQEKIAFILRSLDDKIKLNQQINQTLEQIAQTLFKSWFVDFEPTRAKIFAKEAGASPEEIERAAMCAISGKTPDQLVQLPPETQQNLKTTATLFPDALVDSELGEVPEGWKVGTLGDLISFNPQRTLKKGTFAPYLDMKNVPTEGHLADDVYLREMASGMKFINGDTLLARITPCLENGKTAYVDFLEEDQVGWGSTEFIVMRPKEGRPLSLGYIIARLEVFRLKAIQTMTGSSGRQRADANVLSQQPWINYPIELLEKFDLTSGYFLAIAKNNGEQNKALSELRDSLLPKLLSGEIGA